MTEARFEFSDTKHPPRPPAGCVGVYTGPARSGSTQRLLYKSRGIHVTVSEARGRFTVTARWQWDGHSWTHTEMAVDERNVAIRRARDLIELLRSIRLSFGEGRATEAIDQLVSDVETATKDIDQVLLRLRRKMP